MTVLDDTPQCGRETALKSRGVPHPVRCSLPKDHEGPHTFVHTWTDPRDRRAS